MKIVDLRCATIGKSPVVRIVSDEGISGYGAVEFYKPFIGPYVLALKDALVGQDPTNVERCMRRIRPRGAFKPYGAAVSAVEHALWDVAGKAAGVPVYKLLGGKVRDRVRVYNGAVRFPLNGHTPEDYADEHGADEGGQGRLHHHQAGHRLPQRDEARGARLRLRRHRAGTRAWRRRRPGGADRARAEARRRLRRGDEGGARRRGRRWRSTAARAGRCRTRSVSPAPSSTST